MRIALPSRPFGAAVLACALLLAAPSMAAAACPGSTPTEPAPTVTEPAETAPTEPAPTDGAVAAPDPVVVPSGRAAGDDPVVTEPEIPTCNDAGYEAEFPDIALQTDATPVTPTALPLTGPLDVIALVVLGLMAISYGVMLHALAGARKA